MPMEAGFHAASHPTCPLLGTLHRLDWPFRSAESRVIEVCVVISRRGVKDGDILPVGREGERKGLCTVRLKEGC